MFEDPAVWVAVAFVLFILAVGKKGYTIATTTLDKRSGAIKSELDEAVRLREEAQNLLASYQRKQREAVREAEGILVQAREDAERIRADARAELEAVIARRREQAVDKIQRAEAQAVAEVRGAAADLAFRATKRLIEAKVDESRDAKLVADTIKAIGKTLH
jgi:F-type H+-transporting ATPase subunit b